MPSITSSTLSKMASSKLPPLSILPVGSVLRSLMVTTVSSSPLLLRPSLAAMTYFAHTQNRFLNPDRNPALKYLMKKTFYAQFCAGENQKEIKRTVKGIKDLGYEGVIFSYAKEVVMDKSAQNDLKDCSEKDQTLKEESLKREILPWKEGTIETVKLAEPGDFVALKFSGAGAQCLFDLSHNHPPTPLLASAITEICDLAASRGVRLLFDAEQAAVQAGIDAWTISYQQKYNTNGRAVVYGTYQAYLKAAPSVIAKHLAIARQHGFILGVKVVRGAYLGSDPRGLIHDTKEDTDACYDGIISSLVQRKYGTTLKAAAGEETQDFPDVNVVLASHNIDSVRKAQQLRNKQAANGEERVELVYAQLQGMADEVSCELVQDSINGSEIVEKGEGKVDVPRAYKYIVWGTTGECMQYLLRRAQENQDAVQRTRDGRDAMARELVRRVKGMFGLA